MKILITGDFCPNNRVKALVRDLKVNEIFNDFLDIIKESDYKITNLECPVKPVNGKAITKTGPSLSCDEKTIDVLSQAGFNVVTLANNHINDYGREGIMSTIANLERKEILYVGVGEGKSQASNTLHIEKSGISVGIINITENEFSTSDNENWGAHPLDIIDNTRSIIEQKELCDFVIVIYHGGHEGYQYPSPRMKKTFRFFVENGADAIICHHAHCYSGYEIYKNTPIFYGLGNFVFDWPNVKKTQWNEGYAVELELKDKIIGFKTIPYIQGTDQAGVRLMNKTEVETFNKNILLINKNISDDDVLLNLFDDFVIKNELEYEVHLQPYTKRLFRGLFRRGILPNLVGKDKKRRLLNLIRCEAHYDSLQKHLRNKL